MATPTLAYKASPYTYTTLEDRPYDYSGSPITTAPTGHSSIFYSNVEGGASVAHAPIGVSYSNLLSTFTVGGGVADGFAITAPVSGNLYVNTGSASAPNYKLLNFGAAIADANVINVTDSSSGLADGATGSVTESSTLLFLITGIYYGGAKLSGGDSKLYWLPAENASGIQQDAFGVRAIDNVNGTWVDNGDVSTELNIKVNITAVNDAPAGTDGAVAALEDVAYQFNAADFGFTDPLDTAANALAAVKVSTLPAAGTLKLSGVDVTAGQSIAVADINAGNFTYLAAAGQSGSAYADFTFQVQDDGGTANGGIDLDPTPNTLTINVTGVNDAPAGADKTVTVLEDGAHAFTAADFGFTDPDDVVANALLAVKITTLPAAGELTLNSVAVIAGDMVAVADIPNLVYTPAANGNGAGYASFTFQVQDDGGTANGGVDLDASPNTITVDVTAVNDAPAGADDTLSTPMDTPITFSAGDFGFSDPQDSPADNLAAVIITALPAAGSLTLDGVAVTVDQEIPAASLGLLVFTPVTGETGVGYASIGFKVKDDGGTANGGVDTDASANTLSITVGSIDTAPEGTDASKTIDEDATYTFAAADFGFTDVDVPAQNLLAVKITTLPATGTLTLDGVAVTAGQVVMTADIPLLVFSPVADGNGAPYTTFTFQVQDDGLTPLGGEFEDPTPNTFTLNVTPVNDAPTLEAVTATIAENDQAATTTDANLTGTLVGADVDVGDTLTYGIDGGVDAGATVSLAGSYGTLTVTKATGAYSYAKNAAAIEAMDAGDLPSDAFVITVSDGVAPDTQNLFTVNLTGADDAPTLGAVTSGSVSEDDQLSTTTDANLSGTLAGADVDAGDTLTYGIDGGTDAGDTVTMAGNYGTLTVTKATGAYVYTKNVDAIEALDDGDAPSDVFVVTVSDGDNDVVAETFTVDVTGMDDAPTLGATIASVAEDRLAATTTDTDLTGTLVGADVDAGDTLEYGISGGVDGGATVSLAGTYGTLTVTKATGAYSYAKNAAAIEALDDGATPSDVFTVTVSDGDDALVTNTLTVNVEGADDQPTLGAVVSGSVAEDDQAATTTDANLSGTLVGADVDTGDTLTYGISGGTDGGATVSFVGTYGTLTVTKATGDYSYAKNAAAIEALDDTETDSDVFTVTVSDGDDAAVTQTYTVDVSGADDAPTLGAVTSGSVTEIDQSSSTTDVALTGTLAGADVDVETLTYGISGGTVDAGASTLAGTYGTLVVDTASGAYTYMKNDAAIEALDDGETDSDVFTVTVTDGDGPLVTQTYTVDITGMDDAPTLAAATASVAEDRLAATTTDADLTGTLAGDDVDGDTLTYGISGGTDNLDGTFSLVGTYGTLTVTAATGAYVYAKNAAAIEALDDTETDSDVFTVTVSDGDDADVTNTLTVNVTGADDQPTLGAVTSGSVSEDDQVSTTTDANLSGTLVGADVDGDTLTYGIDGGTDAGATVTMDGTYGTLTVTKATGAYSYAKNTAAIEALDDGDTPSDVFVVTVSDGDDDVVAQTFTVDVTGMDDAPTLDATVASVAEDRLAATTTDTDLTGMLPGADVDAGDTLTYGITGGVDGGATVSFVGTYGTLTVTKATGAYSYAKNAAVIEALDDGATPTDVFTVTVSDGDDADVSNTLTVNVTGADDQPTLGAVTSGSVAEDDQAATTTDANLSGTLVGADVDTGDTLTYGISGGTDGGATVSFVGTYGTLTVTKATGDYSYAKNAAAIEALDDTETDSDVFTVTVSDGDDAAVTQTYTVDVSGADDAPTLGAVTSGSVTEIDQSSSTTDVALTGTLAGADVDIETLTYGITGGTVDAGVATLAGTYGTLTVDVATGAYAYTKNDAAIEALDDGETDSDVFTVTVTDGDGPLVTQTYTVDITGMDDAPTLAAATASVAEDRLAATTTDADLTGTLAGDDVDVETLTYGISGGTDNLDGTFSLVGTYGTLTVTAATGAYVYAKNAAAIEALDDTETDSDVFTVTVSDGDDADVTSTLTVNVTGADDQPTLGAVTTGSVSEDDQLSTTTDADLTGTLVGADVDGETLTYGVSGGVVDAGVSTLVGAYGTLAVNTASGAYTYTKNAAAIEALDDGFSFGEVFTMTVSDGDDADVTQSYTVNITGMDDAPTLAAVTAGSIAEVNLSSATTDADLSGTLVGADVDTGDSLEYGISGGVDGGATVSLAGTYGTLTVTKATGAYSYAKNAAAIEALDVGDTPADNFTVTVTDGDDALVTQTYTVNLTGANDAPTVDMSGSQERALSDGGTITDISIADVDDADAQTVSISVYNGTLTLNGTAGLAFGTGDGTADSDMVFSGSVADINTALNGMTFNTSGTTDAVISIFSVDDNGAVGSNYILGAIGGVDSELYYDFTSNETLSSYGADTYVFIAAGTSAAEVTYAVGADTTFSHGGSTLTLTGYTGGINNGAVTNFVFEDGSLFISNVGGGKATLLGSNAAAYGDQLVAGSNGDTLRGLAGDDMLVGGAGADTLYGGNGADMLYGKGGNDLLNGGSGADLFVYTDANGDDGADVIVGFQDGIDHIYLSDVAAGTLDADWLAANVGITAVGGSTLITLSANDTILLLGVSSSNIDVNDFMGVSVI